MYVLRSEVTNILYSYGETATSDEIEMLNQIAQEVNDLTPMEELESTHWVIAGHGWMHCEKCGETYKAGRNIKNFVYCPCCGKRVMGTKIEGE